MDVGWGLFVEVEEVEIVEVGLMEARVEEGSCDLVEVVASSVNWEGEAVSVVLSLGLGVVTAEVGLATADVFTASDVFVGLLGLVGLVARRVVASSASSSSSSSLSFGSLSVVFAAAAADEIVLGRVSRFPCRLSSKLTAWLPSKSWKGSARQVTHSTAESIQSLLHERRCILL